MSTGNCRYRAVAELDLSLAVELRPTPSGWIEVVLDEFSSFLQDHASCEKKASGMALNMASHYPDQPRLLEAMIDLAVEELSHYREVVRIMLQRKVTPGADSKDPYINQLNQHIRKGPENFLLDRLLVGAVVERRGAERFALVAAAVPEVELRKFYVAIAASEERHWSLFIELALAHCRGDDVWPRFTQLSAIEADIMSSLPLRPALH